MVNAWNHAQDWLSRDCAISIHVNNSFKKIKIKLAVTFKTRRRPTNRKRENKNLQGLEKI